MRRQAVGTPTTVLVLVLVIGAGACGESDEGTRLTKAAYVAEADAACLEAKSEIGANSESIPADLRGKDAFSADVTPEDRQRLAPFARRLGEIYAGLRADLAKFKPPEDDQAMIDEVLEGYETAAGRFEAAAESFTSGLAPDGTSPLLAVATPSRALADYGAGNCLSSGN